MKISIVTPWHGETAHLIGDYVAAVQGSAQIVTVDNATPAATATSLTEMTAHLAGEYLRNDENTGFAGGNNQGYAAAAGDIIVFLNSDVAPDGEWLAQVAHDVRDGALYGPSLQAQLVAGRHVPYLEGWCVAATRATWMELCCKTRHDFVYCGPWDAECYPGPYWEDNDLCLRALQQGIRLVQTQWAVRHKGGATTGPIVRHARSFAANERTFTERVLAAVADPSLTATWHAYMQAVYTPSDIQHHLTQLYSFARDNVVELGTRGGMSTRALLAGVEAHGGHVWSIDTEDCAGLFESELWTFVQGSSVDVSIIAKVGDPIDLLFLDTIHTVDHVAAELSIWGPLVRPGGHICVHDTETFPGVRRAVSDYCRAQGWPVTFVLPCNGMAIVEVPA